ncbi:MAG: SPFH/Band 7/PHB domain protein, partial [Candidatus Cloacimonetes bacterium]|nr:SPFH/Band 7/PHB domain protein [Candidatus Cloacimonadota bacterium]
VKSTGTDPAQYLIALKYISAFAEVIKNNDKTVVVPYESSAMLGSVKMIENIFKS